MSQVHTELAFNLSIKTIYAILSFRRSVSSNTSSSSSKPSSAKSSPFARLKKILMLETKQQSKKGGLKDFLSSLWRPQGRSNERLWPTLREAAEIQSKKLNEDDDHSSLCITMPPSGGVIRLDCVEGQVNIEQNISFSSIKSLFLNPWGLVGGGLFCWGV